MGGQGKKRRGARGEERGKEGEGKGRGQEILLHGLKGDRRLWTYGPKCPIDTSELKTDTSDIKKLGPKYI